MKNPVQILAVIILAWAPAAYAMDLLEAFDLAVVNDQTFQEALARRNSAREFGPQAIANLLPVLTGLVDTKTTRLHNKKGATFQATGTGKTQNFWTNSLTLNFTQPVFHQEFWVQLEQSENQIAQAEAEYAAAAQELIVRTTNTYLDILLAKDTVDFSTAEKLAFEHELDQAQQRFEVGLAAITDVLEVQAGYDKSVADEIEAKNSLDDRKEELREIIGNHPVEFVGLGDELPLLKPEPESIEEWIQFAQQRNLNIIAKQNQAEIARKNIELQRSGHYPTVDIKGSYSYQDDNSSFGLRGDTARIGVELNIPFFQGGGVNSRTRQARADFAAAQHSLAAQRRSVIRQVKDGYRGVISVISQVKARAASVRSSKSATKATLAGFETGTRTMVDVVAEQRNLFRSKRDYAETRYNYIKNWIRLKAAASDLTREDLVKFNRLLTKQFEPGTQYFLDSYAPRDESSVPLSDPPAAQIGHKKTNTTGGEQDITEISRQSKLQYDGWVLTQDPEKYTVQLAAFRKETEAKSFISKSEISDGLGYFKFEREGRTWYAIIYGVFAQHNQALQAIQMLPENAKRASPWIMKFSRIQRLVNGYILK